MKILSGSPDGKVDLLHCGIGATASESDEERIPRILYVGASFGSVPALLLYGWLFLDFGAPLAALAMFGYLAMAFFAYCFSA